MKIADHNFIIKLLRIFFSETVIYYLKVLKLKNYLHFYSYFTIFCIMWEITSWLAFKIMDCVIMNRNKDKRIKYFPKKILNFDFWEENEVFHSIWMQPVILKHIEERHSRNVHIEKRSAEKLLEEKSYFKK